MSKLTSIEGFLPAEDRMSYSTGQEFSTRDRLGRMPHGAAHGLGMAKAPYGSSEEDLVVDIRARLTPAQIVESKLHSLLRDRALPVSQVRTAPFSRNRGRGP